MMRGFFTPLLISASLVSTNAYSQTPTLDQVAWNKVWDRFISRLPAGNSFENVHALSVFVPATWVNRDTESLQQLQNYAGAIPEAQFSIDPSRMRLQLHEQYARFVLDAELEPTSDANKQRLREAEARYEAAFKEFRDTRREYLRDWDERKKELRERGEKVDTQAALRFRQENQGIFSSVQSKLDLATQDIMASSAPNAHWRNAARLIREEVIGASSVEVGLFNYQGGFSELDSIKDDCTDNVAGWEVIEFSKSISSAQVRTSNWNANGSWNGSFFSLSGGGGGSNYNQVVSKDDENIGLRFCKMTYVPLRPGAWFDASFLRAIDDGRIKLKQGSEAAKFIANGQKILGPEGAIPRLVKGAIVARRVSFNAKLSSARLEEARATVGGSAGVRIGPFRFGGSGGRVEFSSRLDNASGSYSINTSSSTPIILAIITEPTK